MEGQWLTVSFIPAPGQYFAHYLVRPRETTTISVEVVGWLVQHQYGDVDLAVPTYSRTVAGVLSDCDGSIIPVHSDSDMFIGVYQGDEPPHPDDVESARKGWAARFDKKPARKETRSDV